MTEGWWLRLIEEKNQLADRTRKLVAFFDTDEFGRMSVDDRAILRMQANAMSAYLEILALRIARS